MRILLATVVLALLAAPALAQNADDTLTLTGTMADVCTMSTAPTASGVVNGVTLSGGDVSITSLFNTTKATLKNGTIVLTYEGMCNYAHNVSLRSSGSGLSNASLAANAQVAGSEDFVTRIGYDAKAAWGGGTASLVFPNRLGTPPASAASTSGNVAVNGANNGDLVLTLQFAASPGRSAVVAGTYSDTLFIQIGADI